MDINALNIAIKQNLWENSIQEPRKKYHFLSVDGIPVWYTLSANGFIFECIFIMTYQVLIESPGVKTKEMNHKKRCFKWNVCICLKPQKTGN